MAFGGWVKICSGTLSPSSSFSSSPSQGWAARRRRRCQWREPRLGPALQRHHRLAHRRLLPGSFSWHQPSWFYHQSFASLKFALPTILYYQLTSPHFRQTLRSQKLSGKPESLPTRFADYQLCRLLWSTARGIIVISIPIVICTIFVIYDNTPQPLRYDVYKESSLKTQTCFGKLCISNVCHLSKYNDTPICMSKHVGWVESLKDIVCWCYGVIVAISYKTAWGTIVHLTEPCLSSSLILPRAVWAHNCRFNFGDYRIWILFCQYTVIWTRPLSKHTHWETE